MKRAWCQRCGVEVYEAQGQSGPIQLTSQPGRARDLVRVKVALGDGVTVSNWWVHRCAEVLYPPKRHKAAMNRALEAFGLDPMKEREDSA